MRKRENDKLCEYERVDVATDFVREVCKLSWEKYMTNRKSPNQSLSHSQEDIEKKAEAIVKLMTSRTRLGAKEKALQIWQWVGNASLYSNIIIRENVNTNDQVVGLFWIRLYGILVDIYCYFDSFSKAKEKAEKIKNQANKQAFLREIAKMEPIADKAKSIIETIKSKFSPDELVYLQYRRDVESHPFQTKYELSISADGVLKDKRKCSILSKEPFDKDEVDAMIQKVIKQKRYNHSEKEIAIDFARRIDDNLEELWKLSNQIKKNALLFGRMAV